LLLAAGKLRGVFLRLARQSDQCEQCRHARANFGAWPFCVFQTEGDVLLDGQVGKQRVGLENDAVVALRRRQGRDVLAGLPDGALRLQVEASDCPEQRGLATAGRPQKADELALRNRQRHIAQCNEVAVGFPEIFDLQISRLFGSDHQAHLFRRRRQSGYGLVSHLKHPSVDCEKGAPT
jgi:hypothetical protein